jgi:hypothetical protein
MAQGFQIGGDGVIALGLEGHLELVTRFLFYKPIISQFYFSPQGPGLLTCRRSSLDSMMSLYRDLFLQERATDYILFPLGLLSFLGKISQCTQRVDSS